MVLVAKLARTSLFVVIFGLGFTRLRVC